VTSCVLFALLYQSCGFRFKACCQDAGERRGPEPEQIDARPGDDWAQNQEMMGPCINPISRDMFASSRRPARGRPPDSSVKDGHSGTCAAPRAETCGGWRQQGQKIAPAEPGELRRSVQQARLSVGVAHDDYAPMRRSAEVHVWVARSRATALALMGRGALCRCRRTGPGRRGHCRRRGARDLRTLLLLRSCARCSCAALCCGSCGYRCACCCAYACCTSAAAAAPAAAAFLPSTTTVVAGTWRHR
jgi:hypothetical protein